MKEYELRELISAQAQEIERLNAEIKKAFWWSAEFTKNNFDNRILEAWHGFLEVRERQAKEAQARREQND